MVKLNIGIAGLGNVGSALIETIEKNKIYFADKTDVELNIIGISAKTKNKKRDFNISNYSWYDDPREMSKNDNFNVIVELIGEEKGISYEIIETALKNKKHVVTGNKSLIANHGKELFELANLYSLALSYEAAVAGGVPIIKTIKNSINLDKIHKISGILNGTTNYILTKMQQDNMSFDEVLKIAKDKGFTSDQESKLDIGGYDAAHKLTILSTLCFRSKLIFDNNHIEGISNIKIEDINFAEKLGYKIKLISEACIIDNKISNFTSPKLVQIDNPLASVDNALNAINIESFHLENLFLEGEGAGGKPTASSILSDLYDISQNKKFDNLGFKIDKLKKFEKYPAEKVINCYYLRIMTEDKSGVLSSITNYFSDSDISVKKILQLPENSEADKPIPIIITTHNVQKEKLSNVIHKIESLEFVKEKITLLPIHDN